MNIAIYLSLVSNIITWIIGAYLYLENRMLKKYEVERDRHLKLLEAAELTECFNKEMKPLTKELEELESDYNSRTENHYKEIEEKMDDLDMKQKYKLAKLKAEIEHYDKFLSYKWLFPSFLQPKVVKDVNNEGN